MPYQGRFLIDEPRHDSAVTTVKPLRIELRLVERQRIRQDDVGVPDEDPAVAAQKTE
jgi:hypothetical protein